MIQAPIEIELTGEARMQALGAARLLMLQGEPNALVAFARAALLLERADGRQLLPEIMGHNDLGVVDIGGSAMHVTVRHELVYPDDPEAPYRHVVRATPEP